MTTGRIFVICKYNQARSITAAAAIRNFFPELNVISAGIVGDARTPIPGSIIQILNEWGLQERDKRSKSIADLSKINESDLVLCADSEVRKAFISKLNLDIALHERVHLFEKYAKLQIEIPIDPVNMNEDDTKMQLSRSILLCTRAVRIFKNEEALISDYHLPDTMEDHRLARDYLTNLAIESKGILIDTGFSIPNKSLWGTHAVEEYKFTSKLFVGNEPQLKPGNILVSKYEMDNTGQFMLSTDFQNWLTKISSLQKIFAITQPLAELPPGRQYETILSIIHS